MTSEKDYLLGTHDDELERLGLQHRVWRPRTTDAWQRAGFTAGQTLIDIGCGPGYATLDLADIVGPSGRVVAIDRSRRFLDHLEAQTKTRGIRQVEAVEIDLDDARLPEHLPAGADGAWGRWVFAFVQNPRALLERVSAALKPGGRLVIYEYFDYSTWKLAPRSAAHELFVQKVVETWRASGGETEIGLSIPGWLTEMGFRLETTRPLIDIVGPRNYIWQWPKAFIEVGVQRMLDLGALTPDEAQRARRDVAEAESRPDSLMITPGVIEIIATKGA